MISSVSRRLIVINGAVIFLLLAVFSLSVYLFVTHSLHEELRQYLWTVTDTAIASIEPDEVLHPKEPDEAVPDVIHSSELLKSEQAKDSLTLEWFDKSGNKLASRGALKIILPLKMQAGFENQDQAQEHAHVLILTRSVKIKDDQLGYLRVGKALAEQDRFERKLIAGLVSGTVLALLVSCFVVFFLVREALAPIMQSMARLKQFTADASHELKNPLMAIKTNAAVALKYKEGMREKDEEKFTAIVSAADQVIKTTADLLRLAESENKPASPHVLDVVSCINTAKDNLTARAQALDVKIEIEPSAPAGAVLSVVATDDELLCLFGNILDNAVQYSKPDGTVKVAAELAGETVTVTVEDNGIGIAEADLPFVFDRFYRADRARSHNTGGNGLGLAIAQSIAARYKITIAMTSRLGQGTTVTIKLPAAPGTPQLLPRRAEMG